MLASASIFTSNFVLTSPVTRTPAFMRFSRVTSYLHPEDSAVSGTRRQHITSAPVPLAMAQTLESVLGSFSPAHRPLSASFCHFSVMSPLLSVRLATCAPSVGALAAVCATHVYPVAGLQVCNTYIYIVIFCVSSSLQRVVPPGLSRATPVYPFSLCGGEHSDR